MKYERIMNDLKEQILANELKTNDRLPSIRQLCDKYNCNKDTVQRAYNMLIQQGLVYSKHRSGHFVAPKVEPDKKNIIDMQTGNPSVSNIINQQFYSTIKQALLFYNQKNLDVNVDGVNSLHQRLLSELQRENLIFPNSLLYITQGIMQILSLLSNMSFPNEGEKILIEEPTYSYYIDFLLSEEIDVLSIQRTGEGIDLKQLEYLFQTEDIKFFYIQPHAHNPLGHDLSLDQKKEIVRLALKYDIFLVEDAYFLNQKTSLYELAEGENCIYLKSYTKTLPYIRMGFMLLPEDLFFNFKAKQEWSYFYSYFIPSLASHAIFEVSLLNGFLSEHTKQIEKDLTQKKAILLNHANTWNPKIIRLSEYDSGYYFTVILSKKIKTYDFVDTLQKHHLAVRSNVNAFINPGNFDNSIRLTLARVNTSELDKALKVFYQVAQNLYNT